MRPPHPAVAQRAAKDGAPAPAPAAAPAAAPALTQKQRLQNALNALGWAQVEARWDAHIGARHGSAAGGAEYFVHEAGKDGACNDILTAIGEPDNFYNAGGGAANVGAISKHFGYSVGKTQAGEDCNYVIVVVDLVTGQIRTAYPSRTPMGNNGWGLLF